MGADAAGASSAPRPAERTKPSSTRTSGTPAASARAGKPGGITEDHTATAPPSRRASRIASEPRMRTRGGPAPLERLSFRRRCLNHSTPTQETMLRFAASATRQSASWATARAAVQGRARNGSAQRVAASSAAKASSGARPAQGVATHGDSGGEAEEAELVAEHVQLRSEVEQRPRRQPTREAALPRQHRARSRGR